MMLQRIRQLLIGEFPPPVKARARFSWVRRDHEKSGLLWWPPRVHVGLLIARDV